MYNDIFINDIDDIFKCGTSSVSSQSRLCFIKDFKNIWEDWGIELNTTLHTYMETQNMKRMK